MQKRGITTFRSKFLVSQYRKISLGNTSVYQKNSGSEKLYASERGGYQDFPSKIFCLTVPKKFVREPFSVSLISGIEKVWIRGGGVSRFSVEIFMSHSAENFRKGILLFLRKFLVSKSFTEDRGVSRFFVGNFWSQSAEKFRTGILYCCNIFGYRQSLDKGGGSITIFRRNFYVSQCRKLS